MKQSKGSWALFSLDFKILFVVCLIVLSLSAGSILLFKRLADEAEELLFDAMNAMSHAVHHALAGQFYERYFDVQAFAKNPSIQSMDPARIEQALNTYVQLYEIYDLILVTDDQGQLIASNTVDPHGAPLSTQVLLQRDFSQESWFQAVMQGRFTDQPQKNLQGTFVTDPALDPHLKEILGLDRISNAFASAITDGNGHVLGVICNRAGVRWIEREFQHAYQMFKSGGFSDARLELIDQKGMSLVSSLPSPEALSQSERQDIPSPYPGSPELASKDHSWVIRKGAKDDLLIGSSLLNNSKIVDSLGWSIRITVSASTASRNLASTVRMSYGLIILAAGLIMLLSVGYARRLLISRFLQTQVKQQTSALQANASALEQRNEELERHKLELLDSNKQLILAQKELLETAKRLGQSEVAALTLHNIGNIITSLNIQTTLLREQLDTDVPGELSRVYLKKVAAGKELPEAFDQHLQRIDAAESDTLSSMRSMVRGMVDNVRMAMSAISAQVGFVQNAGPEEEVRLSTLLRNILNIYDGTFKRHDLQVKLQIDYDGILLNERFRFDSVLTVLIRNAIDATIGQSHRQLHFYTTLDAQHLALAIADNGHGFDTEIAGKLFRFGFTTKESGHGFGLHYAANSCKHMGFVLKLESPGTGQGATAWILIPREKLLSVSQPA